MTSTDLEKIISKYRYDESSLIGMLQDIQKQEGYLPRDTLMDVARQMDVSPARIFSLASFYKSFSLTPRGRHVISVCMGTACHVKGGVNIVEMLKRELDILPGETTFDDRFTLELVRCVGCCGLAPVIKVDDDFYGKLTQSRALKVLSRYK